MGQIYKICFLGYRKLGEIAREIIARMDYEDTVIVEKDCNIQDLEATVREAQAEGCEVFIAGSANAAEFRNRSYGHLVEIRVDLRDYLLSIRKVIAMGAKRIGIAVYKYSNSLNAELLRRLVDTPFEVFYYEENAELYQKVQNSDCDCLIGASFAVEVAENLGINSSLIYENEYTILASIERARRKAAELRREAREREISTAIVQRSLSGVIVTDDAGKIVLFNPTAKTLTAIRENRPSGRMLAELIPSLSYESFCKGGRETIDRRHIINGAMLRCVQSSIHSGRENLGMLVTILPDNSRRKRQKAEETRTTAPEGRWENMISESSVMKQFLPEARRIAEQEYPLMIKGELGTGKRFLAQCIHNGSSRAKEPFMVINAAILSSQDAARVLFGSEDGEGVRTGLLEAAGGGTVVLQNLAHAEDAVKACILQVLTERSFYRIGGLESVPFRARFLTLCEENERKRISENLWQRLSVFSLTLPPLRERREDIVPMFRYFLQHEDGRIRLTEKRELIELLEFYSWKGNLAELSGVCRRYAMYCRQAVNPSVSARQLMLIHAIGEDELLEDITEKYPVLRRASDGASEELMEGVAVMKRMLHYNNSTVADKLGLGRTTLWRMQKGQK